MQVFFTWFYYLTFISGIHFFNWKKTAAFWSIRLPWFTMTRLDVIFYTGIKLLLHATWIAPMHSKVHYFLSVHIELLGLNFRHICLYFFSAICPEIQKATNFCDFVFHFSIRWRQISRLTVDTHQQSPGLMLQIRCRASQEKSFFFNRSKEVFFFSWFFIRALAFWPPRFYLD